MFILFTHTEIFFVFVGNSNGHRETHFASAASESSVCPTRARAIDIDRGRDDDDDDDTASIAVSAETGDAKR